MVEKEMTLGLTWMMNGGFERVIILTIIWVIIIVVPIFTGWYYFWQKPMEDHWKQVDAQIKAKTQSELNLINNMTCEQLHKKLLSTDHFYDSGNEEIARDHYVANCGVRLP